MCDLFVSDCAIVCVWLCVDCSRLCVCAKTCVCRVFESCCVRLCGLLCMRVLLCLCA